MLGIHIAYIDWPLLLLIRRGLGAFRSSLTTLPFSPMKSWCLWPFLVDLPMPQRESMLVLEKPVSTLNTKRAAYVPIPVISTFISTDSSVDQIPTKYPLSSVFWMGLIPIKYSLSFVFWMGLVLIKYSLSSVFWMGLYKENISSHTSYLLNADTFLFVMFHNASRSRIPVGYGIGSIYALN